MINAFYAARSGILNSQNSLGVTANNISNVNTTGYKEQRANFADLLYTNVHGIEVDPANLKSGNGAKLQEIAKIFTQGPIEGTGRTLDVGISGDGFFCVSDAQGNLSYTRDGSFNLSQENGVNYLTASDGSYVLDGNLNRIVVPNAKDVTFSPADGLPAQGNAVKPGVFTFSNPYALNLMGNNRFEANTASGQPVLTKNCELKQNALERSNVDLVTEMEKMIEQQRGFQFNAKMLQVTDEMEQTANQLRT